MLETEQKAMLEAMFDATYAAQNWLACHATEIEEVDSRDTFRSCMKAVEVYMEAFPDNDDPEYMEHIEHLTYISCRATYGLPFDELDELLLEGCDYPKIAWYCYDHDMTQYDYDCWANLNNIMGEEMTFEQFHLINGWYNDDLAAADETDRLSFRWMLKPEAREETVKMSSPGCMAPTIIGNAQVVAASIDVVILRFAGRYTVGWDPLWTDYYKGLTWTTCRHFSDAELGGSMNALKAAMKYAEKDSKEEPKHV